MAMRVQEFPCKEPGCDKKVVFTYGVVDAVVKMPKPRVPRRVGAYLTCDKGHRFSYEVEI
jgi:hypothetical protein